MYADMRPTKPSPSASVELLFDELALAANGVSSSASRLQLGALLQHSAKPAAFAYRLPIEDHKSRLLIASYTGSVEHIQCIHLSIWVLLSIVFTRFGSDRLRF